MRMRMRKAGAPAEEKVEPSVDETKPFA